MKKENEKLAAAGGGSPGDSKLEEMFAAKQAELQVPPFLFDGKYVLAAEQAGLQVSFVLLGRSAYLHDSRWSCVVTDSTCIRTCVRLGMQGSGDC